MRNRPALSLIELMLVVTIVGILATAGGLGVVAIRSKQAVGLAAENLAGVLRQAHIFSREDRDQKSWGVKLNGPKGYMLVGRDAGGSVIEIAKYKLGSPVVFVAWPAEVWFDRGTGGTAAGVSWRMTAPRAGVVAVEVSAAGVVTVKKEGG